VLLFCFAAFFERFVRKIKKQKVNSTTNHNSGCTPYTFGFISKMPKRVACPAFGVETEDARRLLHMFMSGELSIKTQPQAVAHLFPVQAVLPSDKFRSGFNRVRDKAKRMLSMTAPDMSFTQGKFRLIVVFVVVTTLTIALFSCLIPFFENRI
jgi:hypothetical protein